MSLPGPLPDDPKTAMQVAFLQSMTNTRVKNLWTIADVMEDRPELVDFFRSIGDPKKPHLLEFLSQTKPETFVLLTGMREEEVEIFKTGLKYVVAVQLLGGFLKWGSIITFSILMAMLTLQEKIAVMVGWKK